MTVFDIPGRMDSACCANPFMGAGFAELSLDPKICSRMAWNECPGSASMKRASFDTATAGESGSAVESGFDSSPVSPSMSGRLDFSQPRTWSNERFSITITTTVFMGPGILCFFLTAAAGECGERMRKRRRRTDTRRRCISGDR
ncbi:hypothetical protein CR513_62494, partial [Mucuna pruriens]